MHSLHEVGNDTVWLLSNYKIYLPIFNHTVKFCLNQLTINISYRILKWIFIALIAFTLVAPCFKASAQNWYTLKWNFESIIFLKKLLKWFFRTYIWRCFMTFVCSFEGIRYPIFIRTLVNIQHSYVHRNGNSSPKIRIFSKIHFHLN